MVLSLIAIIILSPILLITYLLVRVKFGKPAIFIQKRVGKDGKVFDLYKFRTMTNQRDEDGKLLPDDQRLTSFGKKLRSTSLDELPELFNVLKGDMALIGPRPLLVKYLPLYNDEQARRHEVRPGLTGYAQVNGRNTITWEDRLKLDVEYVDNVTFLNDWKIIFKTIKTVFKREGISEKGSATMDEFKGNGHRV
ncbi:sugar transferase [Ligilactobacillus salivarius]|uniref:sugar transferase n=1 Tax=Ligilactobacillus salivarius TaxID=1624 RepID=UPI00237E81A1|nr:sugar transferase [Ligilactobacillus salivarius]MDE1524698.1 sugar transferase [Ligilactobacillus salivarius]